MNIKLIKNINDLVLSMEYLSLSGGFNIFMKEFSLDKNFEENMQIIVNEFIVTDDLLNSIAIDQHTPLITLLELKKSKNPAVSSHAILGILKKRLDSKLEESELRNILSDHDNDAGISLGVRLQIANHLLTPNSILEILSKDEADVISNAAQINLSSTVGLDKR